MANSNLKSTKLTTKLIGWKERCLKDGLAEDVILAKLKQHLKNRNVDTGKLRLGRGGGHVVRRTVWVLLPLLFAACAISCYIFSEDILEYTGMHNSCWMETNELSDEITRHMFDCEMCRDLKTVPVVYDISKEEFEDKYAYTSKPVLVKEGTTNWTAMQTFNYAYFKELYVNTKGALDEVEEQCQFFPYQTNFLELRDAFNMTDERANYNENEEPWYIGWSNCLDKIGKELRTHYQKPTFLPTVSTSSSIDWIFMGGSGLGASMHIDNVDRPSWQAQISGSKTWYLVPSVECADICHDLAVTVKKGDIVVVNTNMWYHATEVTPGEISIAIGSEFD